MKKWLNTNRSALLIFFVSTVISYPLACRVYGFFEQPISGKALLFLSIWAGITGLLWLLDLRWGLFMKFPGPGRKQLALSLLAALTCLILFHWQPPAFPSTFHISIQADSAVQLTRITSGGRLFELDHFKSEGDWKLTESGWQTTDEGAGNLIFSGSAEAPIEMTFITGPDYGDVNINLQGQTIRVGLDTPKPDLSIVNAIPGSYGSVSPVWIVWVGMLLISEFFLLAGFFHLLLSRYLAGTVAFLLPLFFLLPYVTTSAGHNVSLGNDFGPFYYVYKTYLLDFLSEGTLPLWSPSEAAGFPFFSNPLAQAMYPVNAFLALIYRINGGYTRLDHQVFTVAAICWFSLGLYVWLRALNIKKRHALPAALIMALSYKMTELIRFPNATHEAAWYPWILLALTRLSTAREWKTVWLWTTGLSFSLICLFTAGYPYYVYYLPFLAGPYLLFLLIPRVRVVLFGIGKLDWRKYLTGFSTACLAALVVCGPYLYQMAKTIALTAGRAGDDFTHATMYPFDFLDTLESLVYPVAARPEGWFYFGALPLTLIILYLVRPQKVSETEEPEITLRRSWPVKVALVSWLVFLSYISYGEKSYLFLLFYKLLPAFSALRGWGRLSIALLPGLALLLAYALGDLESRLLHKETCRLLDKRSWLPLAGIALFSLGFQIYEFSHGITDEYWQIYFIPRVAYLIQTAANVAGLNIIPDRAILSTVFSYSYMGFSLLAVIIVAFLLFRKHGISFNRWKWVLAGLGLFSMANLWCGGPWLWNNGFTPREDREAGQYARLMPVALKTPRKNENSTLTLSPAFSVGSPPKWHFSAYQDFYFDPAIDTTARDELLGVIDGRRFFFSSSIDHSSIDAFLTDARRFEIKPEIIDYTGDLLQVNLTVPSSGYFSFIDNLDENWIARVDGQPEIIEPLFGTFKSLKLEPGEHGIIIVYCPRLFQWANPACAD